jgi:hypothetical protein
MNRLITRLILAFAVTSLAVVLLPLLQSGSGASLVGFLSRDQSLVLYASYLTVFLAFVLPVFMARDEKTRPMVAWAAVAGSTAVSLSLASLLLFVLPALLLYRESVGVSSDPIFTRLSPLTWIYRVARLREVPGPWPFIVTAATFWILALMPRLRARKLVAPTAAALLLFSLPATTSRAGEESAIPPQEVPGLEIKSLSGGVCRAGFRLPLQVSAGPAEGRLRIRIGDWVGFAPADGQPHVLLAIPGLGDRSIEVHLGSATRTLPLPAEVVPHDRRLVAFFGVDVSGFQELATKARLVGMPAEPRLLSSGSYEAFDALVLPRQSYEEAGKVVRAALEEFAALGGRLVLLDSGLQTASARSLGTGYLLMMPPGMVSDLEFRAVTQGHTGVLDTGLIQTFASPRWQEMDLSALLLFAVVYHGAFLLAFLLPLLIDSKKSVAVYLVSVGFVVIAVALLAFNVLQDIFLKKTQVYTQSITLMVQSAEPDAKLVGRQFLCYASMSEETRDLRFDAETDIVPYRTETGGRPVVLDRDAEGRVLRDVILNRRQLKTLVRVDRVGSPVFRVRRPAGDAGRFQLEPVAGAADPWGLLGARREYALLVERGAWAGRYRADGFDLVAEGPALGISGTREVFFRKLLGRFPPPYERYLLIVLSGLQRPDQTEQYLWVRDLGAFLIVPLSKS